LNSSGICNCGVGIWLSSPYLLYVGGDKKFYAGVQGMAWVGTISNSHPLLTGFFCTFATYCTWELKKTRSSAHAVAKKIALVDFFTR
jgi:hypothetical protein